MFLQRSYTMARACKNLLAKDGTFSFFQAVDGCVQFHKISIDGTTYELVFVMGKTAAHVVTSVDFWVPDHGKYKKMSEHSNSPVKLNFAWKEPSTISISCPHKDKVFDVVSDRVLEVMEWYKGSINKKKVTVLPEWKHITPFLRYDPVYYYDASNSMVYSGVNRFEKKLLAEQDEKTVRTILDFVMAQKDFGCKEKLINMICRSFMLDLPEAAKAEFKAEKMAKKERRVKEESSSSSGALMVVLSSDEDEEDTVSVEYTGRAKKEL